MHLIYSFLLLLISPFFVLSQHSTPVNDLLKETYEITLTVESLKPATGNIQIGLYNKEKGFMHKETSYSNTIVKVDGITTVYTLKDIPAGTYAICVFHDANENGYLDKNFLRIPKEGFGFTHNPKCTFGPPKYKDCTFELNSNKSFTVKMIKY